MIAGYEMLRSYYRYPQELQANCKIQTNKKPYCPWCTWWSLWNSLHRRNQEKNRSPHPRSNRSLLLQHRGYSNYARSYNRSDRKIPTIKLIHEKWISIRKNNVIILAKTEFKSAQAKNKSQHQGYEVDIEKPLTELNSTLQPDLQIRNPASNTINILDIKVPFDEFEKFTIQVPKQLQTDRNHLRL